MRSPFHTRCRRPPLAPAPPLLRSCAGATARRARRPSATWTCRRSSTVALQEGATGADTTAAGSLSSPFHTTRLPSLQNSFRTVSGVEETTAILEEVSSNIQQFAPSAESIARRLSPRAARELARALAADEGTAVVRPPSRRTLLLLGISSCVPFIGFGCVRLRGGGGGGGRGLALWCARVCVSVLCLCLCLCLCL